MGTRAPATATDTAREALAAWRADGAAYLQGLSDSEFIGQWAAVRYLLVITRAGNPEHPEIKRLYAATADEYYRRMNGGMMVVTS